MKVCLIDDDRGPIDLYFEALQRKFGDEQVARILTLPDAVKHLAAVGSERERPHDLYIIDIMMPSVEEQYFEVTDEGLTSGIFLLKKLREAEQKLGLQKPIPVLMMTSVSQPEILERIGKATHVDVLAKLEWLPSELAVRVEEDLTR
ncbi:MAG: response regulator [Verrucomicrobia bacterium]|nr:response regulator [Verrucomicrobiota bacterium]